jgi:hypothetical protein
VQTAGGAWETLTVEIIGGTRREHFFKASGEGSCAGPWSPGKCQQGVAHERNLLRVRAGGQVADEAGTVDGRPRRNVGGEYSNRSPVRRWRAKHNLSRSMTSNGTPDRLRSPPRCAVPWRPEESAERFSAVTSMRMRVPTTVRAANNASLRLFMGPSPYFAKESGRTAGLVKTDRTARLSPEC